MSAPSFRVPFSGDEVLESLELAMQAVIDSFYEEIGAIVTGLLPAGTFDPTEGRFPEHALHGTYYFVNVAGAVDGQAFAVGDWLVPLIDDASTTTFVGSWTRGDYSKVVRTVADDTRSLRASRESPRGEGALWETKEGVKYVEAPAEASDYHLETEAGVKLYAKWTLGPRISAEAFGLDAKASAASNRAALQAAIDYCSVSASALGKLSMSSVVIPGHWTIEVDDTIYLRHGAGLISSDSGPGAVIKSSGDMSNKFLIDTVEGAPTDKRYPHLVGVHLEGHATALRGYIRLRGTNRARIERVLGRSGCLEHGLLIDATNNNALLKDVYIVQAWNRDLSVADGYVGAIDIDGPDHVLHSLIGQIGKDETEEKYTDGRKCGIRLAGDLIRATDIRGEYSEIGIVYDGLDKSTIKGAMTDLNYGGGFLATNTATGNSFSGHISAGNGLYATDTYDAFTFGDTGTHDNILADLIVTTQSGTPERMRYGVYDVAGATPGTENWVGPVGGGNWAVAPYFNEHTLGFGTVPVQNVARTFPDGEISPNVGEGVNFQTFNNSPTLIANFANMPYGREITVYNNDPGLASNTTISGANQSVIATPGGSDFILPRRRFTKFIRHRDGVIHVVPLGEPPRLQFDAFTGVTDGDGNAWDFDGKKADGDTRTTTIEVPGVRAGDLFDLHFRHPNIDAADVSGSLRNVDIEIYGRVLADNKVYLRLINFGAPTRLANSALLLVRVSNDREP